LKASALTSPVYLGLIALALGGYAQSELLRDHLAVGLPAYALAGIAFCVSAFTVCEKKPRCEPAEDKERAKPTAFNPHLLILAGLLSAYLGILVNHSSETLLQSLVNVAVWLVSIFLFSTAVFSAAGWSWQGLRQRMRWGEIKKALRAHRVEIFIGVGIFSAALVLRTIRLETLPYAIANDEGWVGLEGWRILVGQNSNLFGVGWSGQPILSFLPETLTTAIWGRTVNAIRVVSAVEGALTVLFVYFLVREAVNRRAALLAAGMLIALPPHVHFSRTGFNNILPGFFAALVVWLLFRALRRGTLTSYYWTGLATGATLYTYVGSRLVIALAIGIFGMCVILNRGFLQRRRQHLLVFAGAALVVMAPQAAYFVSHPGDFMTRIATESLFENKWLANKTAASGESNLSVLGRQVERSTLVFISEDTDLAFFNSPRPYYFALGAVFLVLGMVYALARIRDLFYLSILAWFWSAVFFGGVLTTGAPQNQRLVMALPASAILAGLGIYQLSLILENAEPKPNLKYLAWLPAGLIMLVSITQGSQFYLQEYSQKNYYGDFANEFIYETSQLDLQMDHNLPFYVLGNTRLNANFPNYLYFLEDRQRISLRAGNPNFAASFQAGKGALVVAVPEQLEEIQSIAAQFPGGIWREVDRRFNPGQKLYYEYYLPPSR
jgi:4-amino-4-deoxy-L-arabinose transferase-like glycosyltransferase